MKDEELKNQNQDEEILNQEEAEIVEGGIREVNQNEFQQEGDNTGVCSNKGIC